jgi:AcrR family transcriptional regulator
MARKPPVIKTAESPVANARAQRGAATRALILDAAHAVLSERGYSATSVDEIATRAGVSRPTFYAYFTDKLAVVSELSDNLEKEVLRGYRKLAAMGPSPDRAGLVHWVTKRVAETRKQSSYIRIFGQVSAAEPSFYGVARGHRVGVFAMLGESMPAFRAAARDPKSVMAVRAQMLFDQLELVCSMIVLDWDGDPAIAIELMAEQIEHFIKLGDPVSKG